MNSLKTPNLAIFVRPFVNGELVHPSLKDKLLVEEATAKDLTLDFEDPDQRRRFNNGLRTTMEMRRIIERQIGILEKGTKHQEHKPQHGASPSQRITGYNPPSSP